MSKEKLETLTHFQNIVLELSDGRKIKATVPAFCETEEELANIHILKIGMTQPQPLPKESNFKIIDGG